MGNEQVTRGLLDAGADVSARNNKGYPPLYVEFGASDVSFDHLSPLNLLNLTSEAQMHHLGTDVTSDISRTLRAA